MSFLDYVRSKPPHTRKLYALGIAILTTGLVALIWITTVKINFSNLDIGTNGESFTVFKDLLSDTQNQFANVIDAVDSTVEPEYVENSRTFNLNSLSMDSDWSDGREEESFIEGEGDEETTELDTDEESVRDEFVFDSGVMTKPEPAIILIGTTTSRSQ